MNPQITLDKLLEAVRLGDADDAGDALDDLVEWVAKGGFVPDLAKALATAATRADG